MIILSSSSDSLRLDASSKAKMLKNVISNVVLITLVWTLDAHRCCNEYVKS